MIHIRYQSFGEFDFPWLYESRGLKGLRGGFSRLRRSVYATNAVYVWDAAGKWTKGNGLREKDGRINTS